MYYYLNKLYDIIWGDTQKRLYECEMRINELEQSIHELYNSRVLPTTTETDSDSSDSDGSNLAVYLKPRINNTTQVQYITGHTERYNLRRKLYDDMDDVVDMKDPAPSERILEYNRRLEEAGLVLTAVGRTSVIVDEDCEKVKEIILGVQ